MLLILILSLNRYYSNLRQELPPVTDTMYRHFNYPKGITPQEIQGLQAVLGVIRTVAGIIKLFFILLNYVCVV